GNAPVRSGRHRRYGPSGHTAVVHRRSPDDLSASSRPHRACSRLDLVHAWRRRDRFGLSAQAYQFRFEGPLRALSLFGVLILAHLLILPGRQLPLSAWTPIALIWQDVLVALVFAAL